jgi:hypothetical protein
MKFNNQTLINHCNENNIQLLDDYTNKKITRETFIDGKCITDKCDDCFHKNFRQLVKTGAYCKQKAAKDLGLKYEILIFNKSGEHLEKYI